MRVGGERSDATRSGKEERTRAEKLRSQPRGGVLRRFRVEREHEWPGGENERGRHDDFPSIFHFHFERRGFLSRFFFFRPREL